MVISVIIPCYKVERLLERCVESVLKQTFDDFELILVDDGSPDQTGVLADKIALRDARIKIIHQKNGGVMAARHAGAKAANGDWVCFVDSDDTLPKDALQNLYAGTRARDTVEMVVGFRDGVKIKTFDDACSLEDYRYDTIARRDLHVAVYGRLYRRELFTDFMFDIPRNVLKGEDWLFNVRYAFAMQHKPVVVEKCVYHYIITDGGLHTSEETPESLINYDLLRLASIPKQYQQQYMSAIMEARFIPLLEWTFSNLFSIGWQSNPYVTYLKERIKETGYTVTLQQKMLLSKCILGRIIYFNFLRIKYHFI
jgi:glycosyltransferase, group 2 family